GRLHQAEGHAQGTQRPRRSPRFRFGDKSMTVLLSSFDEKDRQWAWDSTSIKLAETCPRKYYYEIIQGWKSPFASVHLWFGGIYAKALETYHVLQAQGASHAETLDEVLAYALTETWEHERDEAGNRIPSTGHATTFDEPTKT